MDYVKERITEIGDLFEFEFSADQNISIPPVILICGIYLSGKSTLAKFLEQHIEAAQDNKVKLLSTSAVLEVMREHINENEEPILHAPAYQCGSLIKEDVITGYLR